MNTLNDEALRATREQLLARGAELRDRVRRVQADLRREREPLPRDAPDAAIYLENDEVLQAIEASARAELVRIDEALEKIDHGTFARCERCGAAIEPARLAVVPDAAECGDCVRRG